MVVVPTQTVSLFLQKRKYFNAIALAVRVAGVDLGVQVQMIHGMSSDSNPLPLSVTELTARMKQMLEMGFANVQVSGEISRLTRPASGHVYFTIKDAHAAISAVIWRSTAARLHNQPQEGGEFIFGGHISLYEPRGAYQLVVTRMEAAGAGKLAAEFERRKQAYARLGWFDSARKQVLPPLPSHIGIVSSPTAAAFEDVKKVLATRPAWLQLTLAPALVQGASAPASIAAALQRMRSMESRPDVVLLVRGGGSMEDLWCFNDERVVKAIVDCPIPVIAGVGHEIDTTLADLAADVRAATPSNAAELCCPAKQDLRRQLPNMMTLLHMLRQRLVQRRLDQRALKQRQSLAWQRQADSRYHGNVQLQSRLEHAAHICLKQMRSPLHQLEKRLQPLQPRQRLQQQGMLQSDQHSRLLQAMQGMLLNRRQAMHQVSERLQSERQQIQLKRQQLAVWCGKLRELDPTRVLERGYSMNFAADGRLITHAEALVAGDSMHVRFQDGLVKTTVDAVEKTTINGK